MRKWLLPITLLVAATSQADRLITIPTGRKLAYETFRIENVSETSRSRTQYNYFGLGIGKSFDCELRTERFDATKAVTTFDFAYNHISPIPGLTPGLAVGVQDVANRTADGRRVYFAATFRDIAETINGEFYSDTTIGFYLKGPAFGFVGTSIPFSKEFRVMFEHNGLRFSSGFEVRPIPALGIRMLFQNQDTLLGVSLTSKF